MRAFIVAIIVFGLTFGISILVLFRYGLSDNQTLPPSTAAENTLKVGTLIALVIAASHWLPLSLPGWGFRLAHVPLKDGGKRASGRAADRPRHKPRGRRGGKFET